MKTFQVKLSAEHKVIENGVRRTAQPGEVITVTDSQLAAFKDRMVVVDTKAAAAAQRELEGAAQKAAADAKAEADRAAEAAEAERVAAEAKLAAEKADADATAKSEAEAKAAADAKAAGARGGK